jgi:hypothetical protein
MKGTPQTPRTDGMFHVMPTVEAIGPIAKTDLWRLPTHLFIPTDEHKTQIVRYIIFHPQRVPKLTSVTGCSLPWSTGDH